MNPETAACEHLEWAAGCRDESQGCCRPDWLYCRACGFGLGKDDNAGMAQLTAAAYRSFDLAVAESGIPEEKVK